MGLDTTHDCWHGAYSVFHDWRCAVARAAGIDLDSMEGFDGETPWNSLSGDVVHVLLNHSDCDGSIRASSCAALADRLEELLPLINGGWQKATQRFIAGLRRAAEADEDVEFR